MTTIETTRHGIGRLAARRVFAIAVLIAGTGLAACEDDPIDPHEHEEGDIAGFRIQEVGSGTVLLTYDGPTGADTLFLPHGQTIEVEVVWLDDHGDELALDTHEHSWELAENHSAIASFVQSQDEPWRGTFTTAALLPGATVYGGYTVTLFHGEEAEFGTSQLVAAVQGD